ncbi:thiamine pyrophosphate-dependent enzyme [Pararhodobacter sp. CCB-MM2]|uniref:thiamine pyrophosphate-dependent enzyme n=1 Tax=Pararhodobacter sp. CCB-MM2 TaxID=1786003 RepID=UPI0009F68DEA|nr:thiamine pyrophosphate-dependent enzyme [Pararhodobacter sp. CCB-MM2]
MTAQDIFTQTGGQALARALSATGTRDLFLLPGIQLDYAVDALVDHPEIALYVPRHEQTVSYMADGFARVTGEVGVGMVVPGPGMLNATAGLSTAYACNAPVMMLVGQIHSQAIGKGYGNLHEITDQSGVLKGLTKWHEQVTDRSRIEAAVFEAHAQARSGRPRPTAVELPYDLLIAKAGAGEAQPLAPAAAKAPDAKAVDAAAALIDKARFPVIYVGGGAMDAGPEVQALAERLGAAVVASDNGRGVLPDVHPLSFNALAGRVLFDKADLVLVIGSRFMDIMTPDASWPQDQGKTFIYLNIDPADFSPPRLGAVCIEADAALGTAALTASVARRKALEPSRAARIKAWAQGLIESTGVLWDYVSALRSALPDDGILVNELTQVGYLSRIAFETRAPRTLIGPGYQGTLGYGFPTALGAAVGGRGRRVFSITGDGGFGWGLQELATAARYQLPVTLVVFNDGYYGNVRAIQSRTFGRNAITELANPRFEDLARAFGVDYARAGDPATLQSVLTESVTAKGPLLVEAPVGPMASPWPLLRLQPMGGGAADWPADL